jgi:ATP-binding cassette, subfamily B, multidrug efflux pump
MSSLRRLFPYVARYRREVTFGLLCSLVAVAIQLAGPWILKYAIDDLTRGVTSQKLLLYAGLTFGSAIVGGVFRYLTRQALIGASRGMEYDLRNAFFAHLQTLPLGYYHAHRTGDLMSRATNDLSAVRMMIGPAVMYATTTVVLFIVALVLMLSINPKLTGFSLIALPMVSISVKYFGDAIHRRFERIQEQLSDLSAIAQETLAGVRVVRAYGQEATELERFRVANQTYLDRNRALIRLQGLFYPSMTFFLGLSALVVLWLGSREVILGRMTLGEFVAFNAYLGMLSWPMIAFGWVTNLLQRGTASWKRMLEILDTPPAIRDEPGTTAAGEFPPIGGAPLRGAIEFRHLNFAYNGHRVLEDISLSIAPGQTVAILGPTGSGKSTLISLLPRLHDPPPGTVFIDGVDVRTIPLAVLRGAIGMVPQEPFLFSETIAENIAFGASRQQDAAGNGNGPAEAIAEGLSLPAAPPPPADLDAVLAVATVARLDKDVDAFPQAWDTMVGERGLTLSGGQKQRTALARALLIDPPILVLDDALSAVDTYTEEEILSRLRGVMRQRTSLIVSHRVSTVRDADLIVVLDQGRIVERGRHEDLLRHGGAYAEMYRKQLLEEELAAS